MSSNDNVVQFPFAARAAETGRRLIPERITEARIAARLNQTELANLLGVKRQSISYYEKGERTPDPKVVAALCEVLGQPLAFFTADTAKSFGSRSANFFRKFGPDTKKRNAASDQLAEWFAQTAYLFDKYVNYPEVDLPCFEPRDGKTGRYSYEEIEECAEATRQHFGLGLGPISNALRLIEKHGVIVGRLTFEGEKVQAFSFWSGERPFVFLASEKLSAARARYDICHELAHLVLHRWVTAEDIEDKETLKEIEHEADVFAGAFLLPRTTFPNEVFSPRLAAFVELKRRWKVSIQAMVMRCKHLGIFDEQQITNLYKQISFKKWRTREPLDGEGGLEFEEPLLLKKVVELVLEAGKMSAVEINQSLAFSPRIAEKLIGLKPGQLQEAEDSSLDIDLR